MNQFNLALDLDKSTARTPPTVRLRQGDQDGTVIAATIYDHGAVLSGTVTACAIVMKLPDGTHYYRKGATWAGGVATVTVDERQAASVVGRTALAYFTVTVGTAQYSTGAFAVVVEPDAVGDAELPEDYDTAIQEAIDRCNAAAAALEGALPIGTNNLANGAVTADKLADAVRKGYVRSFETVAAMQAATDLKAGMTCHTNGFHASGDGGAAYYTVSSSGTANGMNVLALQGGLFATLVVTEPYVTPEQFGAWGDGTHDDTAALQACVNSGNAVSGAHEYLTSGKLTIAALDVRLNTIHYTGTDYAVSIGNGTLNARLDIARVVSDSGGGVILEASSTVARMQCMLQTIRAYGAEAVYIAGGAGGVLDSTFNGSSWVGKDVGLRVAPQTAYAGNLEFNHVRINPNDNAGTGIVIDSTGGTITQLFFNDVSLEKESANAVCNGILINAVNRIEHLKGNFRVVELMSGNSKALTIKGTVQQQLAQCIHFSFDRITPSRIDLSELTMSRYYSLDNPIAVIDAGNIYMASQPQTQRLVIYGNRITFKPLRRTFVNLSSEYTFDDSTWESYPFSMFFATADVTLNVPSWLGPTDEILVNPQGHTVTLKYTDWNGSTVSESATGSNLQRIGICRNANLTPMFYKK